MALFIAIVTGFFFIIGKYVDSPSTFFLFGFIFSFASSIGSYFFSDKIVLMTTGAQPATKEQFFDLYTVTENLSIGAGIPMPRLYIIDDPAPNAFATGRDAKHAVVCVTTGLLRILDRAELEGVIAHELSHIQNSDILVSSIVAVLVGTVAFISDWLIRAMWWGKISDDDRNSKNPIGIVVFILVLVITPIIATLIQLAVSRRREFLADASGALLSRHPDGLARALEKIAADGHQMKNASASTAHLFISNPFKRKSGATSWLTNLFSTHPPVDERVRILRSM